MIEIDFNSHIAGLKLFQDIIHEDSRGAFYESYNKKNFDHLTGLNVEFVQDNISVSKQGTIRGLHFQHKNPQGKLVRVLNGSILDVVVDLRKSSQTLGKFTSFNINSRNNYILWVPRGFAHGFQVTSSTAKVLYKVDNFWDKDDEYTLKYDDPSIGIEWESFDSHISLKDSMGLSIKDIKSKGLLL